MSRADFPETVKTNFDEFKGKDCVFVAEWLKGKGLHKTETENRKTEKQKQRINYEV